MKQLLSTILVIVLALSLITVTAAAAGTGSASLVPSVSEVQPGNTFTVSLNISSNPGVMFFSYTPSYDTERLELVSMTGNGSDWTCVTNANWDGASDESFTGNVVTLNFKVKDNAPTGSASISGGIYAGNYNEEEIPFSLSGCSVSVKPAPHDHNWGSGVILLAVFIRLAYADRSYEKSQLDRIPHGH